MTLTRAQEIQIDDLDDGPGLLPFKLGPMRLVTHYHSFLQYVELKTIQEHIELVRRQIIELEHKLPNDTYTLYEIQINYLNSKIDKISHQLDSLEPHRFKRGLINGLGSIIKGISGNLDYSDAIYYNDAIKVLQGNQDKLISKFNNHISLSKEWMAHHASVLSSLAENQININQTLHLLLDKESYKNNNLIKYAKLAQLLTIITNNVDELASELQRIENALAFTRTSSVHHSMLGIDLLGKVLRKLKDLYSKNQLLDVDLREYYNIIQAGSYYVDRQIVIVFKFPIISPEIYELYKLPIVPNKHNTILIPPYPMLATNGKKYMYIEVECPKIKSRYLCQEKADQQMKSSPDCIQTLIAEQSLDDTCKQTTVTLTRETLEKLDDRHYVMTFPRPTKVRLTCERDEYRTLYRSHLVTIPRQCSVKTNEFTIYNTNDRVEGQPVKILNIPANRETQTPSQPAIALTSINLSGLRSIQDRILSQTPMRSSGMSTASLYHTTTPLYAALCATGIFIATLAYKKYFRRRQNPVTKNDTPKQEETTGVYSIPNPPKGIPAATFSLNALK